MKKFFSLLLVVVLAAGVNTFTAVTAAAAPIPEATAASSVNLTIGGGALKVQAYADGIVRTRFSPNGIFTTKDFNDDRYINTFVDPNMKLQPINMSITDDGTTITAGTAKLDIKVTKATGAVSYYDKSGKLVLSESGRTSSPVTVNGQSLYSVTQSFNSPANERLYGFGNVNDKLGIKGTNVNIQQLNTAKRTPMFVSNIGYGILFDITSNGYLTWGGTNNSVYSYQGTATDSMDYYFLYGPEADTVIAGYRDVTGQAALLPKQAFGYTQSRNRYDSSAMLESIVDGFRQRQIPLDTIVIDYYWWNNGDTGFNDVMNPSPGYSDLAGTMAYLHANNVLGSISVWPSFALGTTTANYLQANWPGILLTADNAGYGVYRYDPSTTNFQQGYWNVVNTNVFSKGLDSIWLDACEPESGNWALYNSTLKCAYGNCLPIGAIYPLLHNRGVYEGQRAIPTNTKRVNSLSRGAVAGIQRYGMQSWSGDINSGFATLQNEIKGVVNYSASGLPFFSTDTGGYHTFNSANENDREMFLRWLEFSTFCSIMRVHGENASGTNNREPWVFGPTYQNYITSYINLRERLVPYTYSLVGKVNKDGYTMVRPLNFDFRSDATALDVQDQYMFGPAFLVNPVYHLGNRTRSVYMPAGKWIDFWSGSTTASTGQSFTVSAPLDQEPLFVRAGSIVPMGPFIQYATQSADPTEVRVYMGADGNFTLYEDEGTNYNYESGAYSQIPFSWNEAAKTLTIGARAGSFPGMLQNRTFNIVFVQPGYGTGIGLSEKYQASVAYNGTQQTVTFDPNWTPPMPPIDPGTLPKPAPAPSPLAVPPSQKAMVGEWLFNEGSGSTLNDTSGHQNAGTLVANNAPAAWTTGKSGPALNFTGGGNTFVQVGDSASLQISDGVTFSAWVYPVAEGNSIRFIMAKGGNDGPSGKNLPGFCLLLNGDNTLQLELQSPPNGSGVTSKTVITTSGTIPNNAWAHVAFTYQSPGSGGDGTVRIYANGAVMPTKASAYFAGPIGVNAEPFNIGRNGTNNTGYPLCFMGTMDEVRLFNYALSGAEITRLVNMQSIFPANPQNINTAPGDGSVTVTWDDPAEPLLDHILVTCTPDGGGAALSFNVPAGTGTLTIPGLANGQYYQIMLRSILSDGETSQGVYVVGMANQYAASIQNPVIYDTDVYGYIVNNGSLPLTGTVKAEVIQGGAVVKTTTVPGFTAAGLDMAQFKAAIGPYAVGQTVKISFVGANGADLAQSVTVIRRATVPPVDPNLLPKPDQQPGPLTPPAGVKAMVGEWMFDEGSGTVLNDTSGHGNTGALQTTQSNVWTTGHTGAALNYTGGGNTFVQVANSPSLAIANEVTFAAWIYPSGSTSDYRFIMSKGGNDASNPGFCLLLQNNSNNRMQLEMNGPNANTKFTVASTTNIPNNTWTHIAYTWKGTAAGGNGTVTFYVNGAPAGTGTWAGPIGVNTEPFNIGRNGTNNTGWPLCFVGTIDEARLWNYALSQSDIQSVMNGVSIAVPNPMNVNASPGDGSINLTWTDPNVAALDHILVTCTPDGGGATVSFNVPKGAQGLTIPGLTNGAYYQIFLQTVLSDGSTSDGMYVVGVASPYKAAITDVYTNGANAYGYVTNYTHAALTGSLVAEVYDAGSSTPSYSSTIGDFTAGAWDMAQFAADIGPFNDGQTVKISFVGTGGGDLAAPVTVGRRQAYNTYPDYAVLDYLVAGGSLDAVTVIAQGSRQAALVVAAYDTGGRLIGLSRTALTQSFQTRTYAVNLSLAGAASAKAFIWDAADMVPLAPAAGLNW